MFVYISIKCTYVIFLDVCLAGLVFTDVKRKRNVRVRNNKYGNGQKIYINNETIVDVAAIDDNVRKSFVISFTYFAIKSVKC